MDTQQQQHKQLQKSREEKKVEDKKQEGKDPSPPPSSASPPSSSSSPAHEFSFTISLHSSSTAAAATTISDKTKPHHPPPHPFAIDLSPADDIFFHGHLLPLHLLSHLPVSPRSSTNSIDSFTLPIRELIDDQKPIKYNTYSSSSSNSNSNTNSNSTNNSYTSFTHHHHQVNYSEIKGRPKSKTFSLFGLTRGRKEGEVREKEEKEEKHKRKLRFDMSRVLKSYVRMVRPLLFFRGRREKIQLRRQPYSFSGNLSFRGDKQELRGRRGEYSAPASMRTSPTNSGLLVATAGIPSSTSDSTMEELQAAIQAAIAHCKNSIAVEEKLK